MIAIPAIDLRDGACVQLVGGSYEDERVRLEDPPSVARDWQRLGFGRLHVVDLDAATGAGSNDEIIRTLLMEVDVPVQVGGGVRTDDRIDTLLRDGAHAVVVGTRAVEDPGWLADVARAHPDSVVVAADVRDRQVVTHGWARRSATDVLTFVERLADLPLAGLLVTAVHREGQMQGVDLRLMEDVVAAAAHPVTASGGVRSTHDLEDLAAIGVHSVVIGMALYTGALDARYIAQEYGQ